MDDDFIEAVIEDSDDEKDIVNNEIIKVEYDDDGEVIVDEKVEVVEEINYQHINYKPMINMKDYKCKTRSEFADKKLLPIIDESIKTHKPLLFMPVSIIDHDEKIFSRCNENRYRIYMYGILLDGRKILMIVENFPLYIDIEIPAENNEREFNHILDIQIKNMPMVERREVVKLFPFGRFVLNKINYLRIHFANSFNRSKVLNELKKTKYILGSDDDKLLYAVYLRNHQLNGCGWNRCKKYEFIKYEPENSKSSHPNINYNDKKLIDKKLSYIFYSNYDDIMALPDNDIEEKEKKFGSIFSKNKTLLMTYDIETYSKNDTGEAPNPLYSNTYDIFAIGMTFHWYYDPKPFYKLCLGTKRGYAREDCDVVYCPNEKELLMMFLNVFESMAPDILSHFNGGNFDNPCMFNKFKQYGILDVANKKMSAKVRYNSNEQTLGNYNPEQFFNQSFIKKENIKISADESSSIQTFALEGVIEIDTMVMMKQIYPKEQIGRASSLNFFLKKNNLDSKEYMPIKSMFQYYKTACEIAKGELQTKMSVDDFVALKEQNYKDMEAVYNYCLVDALRCSELLCKQTVIDDRRELASSTYCGLYEGIYRANGMKIRNLLASRAYVRSVAFSNIGKQGEEGKYPGAYVFYPKRGWHNKRPITGLDFSSLYPSLMMAYNLSPERLITDEETKNKLEKAGYKLHRISFDFNDRKRIGWFVRHNGFVDGKFDDENPLISVSVSKDSRIIKSLPNETMGLFPSILKELFDDRVIYKKKYKDMSGKKEQLEVKIKEIEDKIAVVKDAVESQQLHHALDALENEFSDVSFNCDKINSKQKSKKVVMNTFYGESGNKLSSIREILVSGGTTSSGIYNIKLVAKYVMSLGCTVVYGDTDSVYITCPEQYFTNIDAEYADGKITRDKYWTSMVEITMNVMKDIRTKVNNMLEADNGTKYLAMAYEEVLFPSMYCGKKFYNGIAHENIPNFHPKDIFKRGGEFVKGGRSKLLYAICDMFFKQRYDLANADKENVAIVKELLTHLFKEKWSLDYFAKISKFKPLKKNVSVQTFVARVKEAREKYENEPSILALYPLPEPGDTITTLVIKQTNFYDIRGMKVNMKIGERMEYLDVYKYFNEKYPDTFAIDLRYYLESGVINTFARFICHMSEFQPHNIVVYDEKEICDNPEISKLNDQQNEYIDDYSTKQAVKYIEKLVDELEGTDANIIKSQGKAYKAMYKQTITNVFSQLEDKLGEASKLLIKKQENAEEDEEATQSITKFQKIYESLKEQVENDQKKLLVDYGKKYIKAILKIKGEQYAYSIRKHYDISNPANYMRQTIKYLTEKQNIYLNIIKGKINDFVKIINKTERHINDIIMSIRNESTVDKLSTVDNNNNETIIDNYEIECINTIYKNLQLYGRCYRELAKIREVKLSIENHIEGMVKPTPQVLKSMIQTIDNSKIERVNINEFT